MFPSNFRRSHVRKKGIHRVVSAAALAVRGEAALHGTAAALPSMAVHTGSTARVSGYSNSPRNGHANGHAISLSNAETGENGSSVSPYSHSVAYGNAGAIATTGYGSSCTCAKKQAYTSSHVYSQACAQSISRNSCGRPGSTFHHRSAAQHPNGGGSRGTVRLLFLLLCAATALVIFNFHFTHTLLTLSEPSDIRQSRQIASSFTKAAKGKGMRAAASDHEEAEAGGAVEPFVAAVDTDVEEADAESEADRAMESELQQAEAQIGHVDVEAERAEETSKAAVDSAVDVTLVSQTSEDRVWMVSFLVKRWGGPISIAVYVVSESSIRPERKRLARINRQPGSSIVEVKGQPHEGYPINRLRNLALQRVITSHFLLTDIDLWPSVNSYNEVLAHGIHFASKSRTALVLPAFEYVSSASKRDLEKNAVRTAVAAELPEDFEQLQECSKGKNARCRIFKSSTDTHLTSNYEKWWRSSDLYRISCFQSLRYEPYLVLPNLNSTPTFDERFVGYGKNKIQWIQHLRLVGFNFYVVPKAFVMHCPHPTSSSRQNWAAHKGKKDRLFRDFIRDKLLNATVQTRMCKHASWDILK